MNAELIPIRQIILNGKENEFLAELNKYSEEDKATLLPIFQKAKAQLSHLEFMRYCWGRALPFKIGLHTWYTCKEIDKAINNYRNGMSTFLIILMHFRSGKSEITTRFLPPHFLGEFPDKEVIVNSHSVKNTNKFSRFARTLVQSQKYLELYPESKLSKENAGIEEWGIEGHEGVVQYFGILSGTQGAGAALLVTDDFFGNREDAESNVMRDKIDESFRENIFPRQDDPSINLITVTPWHTDDLVGRIIKKMKDRSERTTPYKIIRLPYKEPNKETIKQIESLLEEEINIDIRTEMELKLKKYADGGYLFPERRSEQWYIDMEASLGGATGYGTQSLLRCDPQQRGGNELKTENVQILKPEDFIEKSKGVTFIWVWDLASTAKEIKKSDPDYTCGTKLGVKFIPSAFKNVKQAQLFIANIVRGRWKATQRNKIILETVLKDGFTKIYLESVAGYKDAFNEVKELLRGIRVVREVPTKFVRRDKTNKGQILIPIFDNSNVFLMEGAWNNDLILEAQPWPDGPHDDQIDTMAAGVHIFTPVKTGVQYDDSIVV